MGLAPVDIFVNEESILRALSFVRHSAITLEKKDQLRDLFLSYTGSAENERETVKTKILEIIGTHPELSSLVPTKAVAIDKIGNTRPTPTFAVPAVVAKQEVIAETPKIEVPAPPPPAPTPVPPLAAPVTPPPAPAAPVSTNAKVRIDTIKRDINGKVGNPVNLIDKNEAVGREYMAALLDAMKRSSKGDNDLARLETAYQAALEVISSPNTSAPASKVEVKIETPPTVVVPEPEPVVVAPTPVAEPKINTETRIGLYHRPSDEVDRVEEAPEPSLAAKLYKKVKVSSEVPVTTEPDLGPLKIPEEETEEIPTPKIIKEEKPVVPKASPPAPKPIEKSEPNETKLRPLNEVGKALPEQISKIKAEAKAREEASNKPITDLKAPEIEQGLRQLLAEWPLFKSSGLFRRQPSGIENPLYRQLAPLPMASVIAGRFEGVTPDIKHTLADYMTGWRYEQGVTHDMGETFEHYLRRVIQVILEKQREAKAVSSFKK